MREMLIETELTPNPATFKFLPGRAVMENGTRDFAAPEEAEASPLAEALFGLGDVTGVFFGREFISVTARDIARPFQREHAAVQTSCRRICCAIGRCRLPAR